MKTIEYRAIYSGRILGNTAALDHSPEEVIRVQARDINAGYTKALKIARQPLGNGTVREIVSLQFWAVV